MRGLEGVSGVVCGGHMVSDSAWVLGCQSPECCVCDASCSISIITGRTLLSDLTDTERQQLSPARLAAGERLACQCKAERGGELIIRLVARSERARTADEKTADLRKEFSELPFERKMATLIQLETIAMSQALDTLADRSVAFGKMIFDTVLPNSDGPKRDQDQPSAEDKRV